MNRIYKVIWSKVKHQYVVVSELAHSNGKQSRVSKNSINNHIAALVVCGAIAAFGIFNAVPNLAFAAEQTTEQTEATTQTSEQTENQEDKQTKEQDTKQTEEQTKEQAAKFLNSSLLKTTSSEDIETYETDDTQMIKGVDTNKGLIIDNGYIQINKGKGLTFEEDKDGFYLLRVELADAKKLESGVVGLEFNSNGLRLNTSEEGFMYHGKDKKLALNIGNGLKFGAAMNQKNEDDEVDNITYPIEINAGKGLTFGTEETKDEGQLKVNVGDGLSIDKDGKLVNDLQVTNVKQSSTNEPHKDGGNWTIADNNGTPDNLNDDKILATNTTLDKVASTSTIIYGTEGTDNADTIYGKDYKVADTDGNIINIDDVASASKLEDVDTRLTSTEGTLEGAVMYDKVKNGDSYDKSSVTLGGKKTYVKGTEGTGVKLTNVAYANTDANDTDNYDGSAAVNVDLLKDYVGANGGGSWNLTTNGETNKVVSVGKDKTVDFAGVIKGEGDKAHQNIHVTQIPDGKGNTEVKFALDDKLVLGAKNQITIDGSNGNATIGGVKINNTYSGDGSTTSSTIGGLTNTTWTGNITPGQAATEDQLQQAISTINGNIKTYSAGDGISIGTDTTGNNKISVNVGDGLSINGSNQIVNNLKVTKPDDPENKHANGGNWTITDSKAGVTLTNTTLSTTLGETEITNGEKEESGKRVVYGKDYVISDTDGNTATLSDVASAKTLQNVDKRLTSTEGDVKTINGTLEGVVMYDKAKDENKYDKTSVTLGGSKTYNEDTNLGGTHLTNVAYATGDDGSEAVNVDYLKDHAGKLVAGNNNLKVAADKDTNGSKGNWTITDTSKTENNVFTNTTLVNGTVEKEDIQGVSNEYGSNYLVKDTDGNIAKLTDVASATKLSSVDSKIGKLNYSEVNSIDNTIKDNDSVTTAIGKLDNKVNTGWTVSDGNAETTDFAVKPGDKLVFNGDGNIDVEAKDNAINISLNDNINLGDGNIQINGKPEGNEPALSIGENKFIVAQDGSLSINNKFSVNAETGDVTAQNITTDTVKGLNNTTINYDGFATEGKAATEEQLKIVSDRVNEATSEAAKHTTVSNGKNISVNHVKGSQDYEIALNDDITLGDTKSTSLTFYTNNTVKEVTGTDGKKTEITGYIPDTYIGSDRGRDFLQEHGGFVLYSTNAAGKPSFGVTTDGIIHAKDVWSYYDEDNNSNTNNTIKYSLNDIGDIVTQIAHGKFTSGTGNTDKEYTIISDFTSEKDKDTPFQSTDEAERTIGLAVREDGAVIMGSVVDKSGVERNGIRINDTEVGGANTITGLNNIEWKPSAIRNSISTFGTENEEEEANKAYIEASKAATQGQLDAMYNTVVGYDINKYGTGIDYNTITLAGSKYDPTTHNGGTLVTNVAYSNGNGSDAVNVDYLKDVLEDATSNGGVISSNEKHLATNSGTNPDGSATYAPDSRGNITIAEVNGNGTATGNSVVISNVASKAELDSLKTNVGDLSYSKVQGDDVKDGDSVTTAIGKLDNKIENISGTATDAANNAVTGGTIKDDGTVSLTQKDGDTIDLGGKLTDSGVIQSGTEFDGETGTLTITSQDKYNKGTSSVTVSGIASKDDIGAVNDTIGVTSKEDLADAYKDADEDGNATTAYITDSETMVDADVALDHAVQDVANTSYYNDTVLNNRINNVENRLGEVEERIDKVGAMAAAIANLRTMGYDPEAPTEVAVGIGQYKSETGIALGIFHYPNQDFMLSASISTSGDEVMGGIGATWRIGRKSAEEKAKDEEERILAKAEEIKQAAKRAEVKAQAERHAKLLAEREAKGEPIVPVEESAEQAQA